MSTTIPTTDPTVAPTTVGTAPLADVAVLDAYRAFWKLYGDLGAKPPPFDAAATKARLEALTVGAERDQLFHLLQRNAATGVVIRGDLDLAPRVESNDGAAAVVSDCVDDRLGVYRVADGSRVDVDSPDRVAYSVQLRRTDGAWRVESVTRRAESCTA